MIREADVQSLVSDTLFEAEAEAERLAPFLGPHGEDHRLAIAEMQEALEVASGINWRHFDEAIAVPYLVDRGECLWLSPRTCSFLNTVGTDWGTGTSNLLDLLDLIRADQRHLGRHLSHPDEAAVNLGLSPGKVRLLAADGHLSHVEIEGIAFIVRDDAYCRACLDLDAWNEERNQ